MIFWGLFVLLSLLTYNQGDPSLNHVVSGSAKVHNGAGLFGAYVSGLLADVFGFAAFVWPLFFLAWGAGLVSSLIRLPWWRWLGFLLLATCLLSLGTAWNLGFGDVRGGGFLGGLLHAKGTALFSPAGSTLIWLFFLFISLELAFGIPWLDLVRRLWNFARSKIRQQEIEWPSLRDLAGRLKPALPVGKLPLPAGGKDNDSGEAPTLIIDLDAFSQPMPPDHDAMLEEGQDDSGFSDAIPHGHMSVQPTVQPSVQPSGVVFREGPVASSHDAHSFDHEHEDDDSGFTAEGTFSGHTEHAEQTDHAYRAEAVPPRKPGDGAGPGSTLAAMHEPAVQHGLSARNLLMADAQDIPLAAPSPSPTLSHGQAASTAQAPQSVTGRIVTGSLKPENKSQQVQEPSPVPKSARRRARPPMPGIDLLGLPQVVPGAPPSRDVLTEKGARLMACLADFGIQGELAAITPGPVISMFELRPAPGVKVSRIVGLSDDLALALKATAVRIQAPVPGSDTVGVEIPNDVRAVVSFRELLQDASFSRSDAPLNMALGKDIGGHPFATDLSRMPHMLVAGATGAGKSVCLNSILLSFLYRCSPEDARLLLIDPKRIELAVYSDLPHLVHPVVTDVTLAKTALEWAVQEMDTRYDSMARLGVRNIIGFNTKLAEFGDSVPAGLEDLRPLPYLVIIIDELSDLMMTAGKDIETHIVRLAQLARAAGIHLIVATQRPSVDVVTGLIKANFPCRIAFQVSSKHDSRTILDTVGAEHLLGKGDMLFKPSGGKLQRLHGAFVSDDEVVSVVEYWKRQQAPNYQVDFSDWGNEASGIAGGPMPEGGDGEDGLYAEVINFVREQGKVSISLIQRRFRIGFNKAARFVEQMEQDGIIQPGDRQNKARVVNRGE